MFNKIKRFHTKFGLENNNGPTLLSAEEYKFRIIAMAEELFEYLDSIYLGIDISSQVNHVKNLVERLELRKNPDCQEQLDALVDLVVFAMGTAERQGFKFEPAFKRVVDANLAKELAGSNENSKRGFSRDLIKPTGWKAPNFDGLMDNNPTGIIIIDGPDGCGKTTLANHFRKKYGAEYFHLTWDPCLEKNMDLYQITTLESAQKLAEEKLVIIDRHWLSELVYSNVYRNGSNWNGLHLASMSLIRNLKALNVVCFPYDKNKYNLHFSQLKNNRDEMYENMSKVYDMYSTLWYGEKHDCFISPVCNTIMRAGGLGAMRDYYHYDFMLCGDDLDTVGDSIIDTLREIQHEC